MRLYYSQGASSLAPHIVLAEAGLKYELDSVDLGTKKCSRGDFSRINPKGHVPALELDNGEVLTEVSVVMQYIADHAASGKLIPAPGTMERYRCLEWCNFIATEIHKGMSPLWSDATPSEFRAQAIEKLFKRFDFASERLANRDFLLGSQFSIADAYLFTVLNWCGWLKIDLGKWQPLTHFVTRMRTRPGVKAALKEEDLNV